ncbi:MAG: T9SS type A sorting domain-containing protein [Chitinophagales bacterium]|nr:T9SS type A sorting domain-containing protein [Chitinophagales bacterium]
MKLKSLLFIGASVLGLNANAQTWVADSVEMGAGYANDVFYSLKNDSISAASNANWHLAFQTLPPIGANSNVSILANHVAGKVNVYSLHMKANGKYGTALTNSDTAGKIALYNSDTSWNLGAFNRMNNPSDPFDFSWGSYDVTSHSVLGDSLYLITINNDAYQVWVQEYKSTPADSISYLVRIAKFDGTADRQIRIYRKNGYTDRNFAYYDVVNDVIRDREPSRTSWDFVLTRAIEYVPNPGGGGYSPYPVTTVLTNYGVTVAEVKDLNPSTTGYATMPYLTDIHVIGSDWKVAPGAPPALPYWTVRDSSHYFIKTKLTNEYYQLHFTNFYGTSNGRAVFQKRKLGDVTSVNNVKSPVTAYSIYPNPATTEVTVIVDAKEAASTMIYVTDMTGKVVDRYNVSQQAGLNGYRINTGAYANGNYLITIATADWKVTEKLSVAH